MSGVYGADDSSDLPVPVGAQPLQQLHQRSGAADLPHLPPGYDADAELATGGHHPQGTYLTHLID